VSTAAVIGALLSYRAIHIERQGKRHRTMLSLCGFRSTDSARSPRAQHRTCRRTWRTANTTEEYSCWSPHGRHQSERGGSGLTPQRVALGRTDCAALAASPCWSLGAPRGICWIAPNFCSLPPRSRVQAHRDRTTRGPVAAPLAEGVVN
jgi:hypothetical protein